ncbi:AsmA family protein [Sphingobium sp. H39-3-25]|uniref:AsmA family protein n=1 Tax=Sphingobium arseniciresistens TaxID=3030834 RepID=UPI0023B9CC51|nr:AsmA family protein [Sphingobium arseniciresistens]
MALSAEGRRGVARIGLVLVAIVVAVILAIGAFPIGEFKGAIEERLSARLGADIRIGAVRRNGFFSFRPVITLEDLRIAQPSWAGKGDMVHARSIQARVAVLPLLIGRAPRLEDVTATGLNLSLVRDRDGRANWEGRDKPHRSDDDEGRGLADVFIRGGHLSLRDDKRSLAISGKFKAGEAGVRAEMKGRFHDIPASLTFVGAPIVGLASDARYPFHLKLSSPLLQLDARGASTGALNLRNMSLDIKAKASNLKYLDDVIEAGLFGTTPIDLTAKVRHSGRDWFVDKLTGRIGSSRLTAKATVLKRDERTKIDADVHFAAFGFDDLSDAEGKARDAAIKAQIGPRVLPGTRINLAKVGPTDGCIRFKADRLLLGNSAFRTLAGTIVLEGKLLRIENIVAGMSSGRMTGFLEVDQRNGAHHPKLSIDLRFADGRLETAIGSKDVTGPLHGRVALAGTGDTIREALATANGRAGLVVEGGTIKRTVAAVLGQDLGKAIGAVLRDKDAEVPLRCLVVGFAALRGDLVARDFIADTGISSGTGRGRISLASERISLSISGQSRNPSVLRLEDPIGVGGTLSSPTISAAGKPPGSKLDGGGIISAVGKSIGRALGIGKKERTFVTPAPIDCRAAARRVL